MSEQRDYGDERDPRHVPSVKWRLTADDRRFLRSLRITVEEDEGVEA